MLKMSIRTQARQLEHTHACTCVTSHSLEAGQIPQQEFGWWQCIGMGYARLFGAGEGGVGVKTKTTRHQEVGGVGVGPLP